MTWRKTPADRRRDNIVYGADWRRQRQRALTRDDRRCTQCGSTRELTVDHILPVSKGGTHDLANLRTLCGPCHRKVTAQQGKGWRQRSSPDPQPKPGTALRADPPAQPTTRW